jgi:hypothetical protein
MAVKVQIGLPHFFCPPLGQIAASVGRDLPMHSFIFLLFRWLKTDELGFRQGPKS